MTKIDTYGKRDRGILLRFFVNADEHQKILKKAEKSQNLSYYLRDIAMNGKVIIPAPSLDRDAFIEMNRIGRLLNELVKILHASHPGIYYSSTRDELETMFRELQSVLQNKIELIQKRIEL